jgi:hypothetical protein
LKASFSPRAALARADEILAQPCAGTLPRVEGVGILVARFVFTLELCSPENRHSHGRNWAHAARKDKLWALMRLQHPAIRPVALLGRPMVRCVRFSIVEPDVAAEGFKTAIDFLCIPKPPKKPGGRYKRGLGFLVDDAPKFVERVSWWERAPRGQGFALLEVWTGPAVDMISS